MGALRCLASGQEITLRVRNLIGRTVRADIRLAHVGVSSDHASIRWNGQGWLVRDLGSLNGTRINGDPVARDQEFTLNRGDVIVFGAAAEQWSCVNVDPPIVRAIRDDGVVVVARGGLLLLPDADAPEASVYSSSEGWEIDQRGATRPIEGGEDLLLGGRMFRLDLPPSAAVVPEKRTMLEDRSLLGSRIIFEVSSDEEHVAITVEVGGSTVRMPSRSFHYMLLQLARARVADQQSGTSQAQEGWVYAKDLAEQLKMLEPTLNVDVHRARGLFAEACPVSNSQDIIERRRGQLRLGVCVIEIRRA